MAKKQETKQIKAYRVVDKDIEQAQEIFLDNEKEFKKIRAEKGIKPLILSESEFKELKNEMADKKTLKDENKELKKQLAELQGKNKPEKGENKPENKK